MNSKRLTCALVALLVVLLFALCRLSWASTCEPPKPWHRVVIERAAACGVDPFLSARLLEVEELAGVPERYRGMLPAKACFESRGNPSARGDWRLDADGVRRPRAIGLLQLWNWAERTTDRRDPIGSAYAYLGAIQSAERRSRRACPGVRDVWVTSWIRVNRGPKWRTVDRRGQQRCHGSKPAGLKLLRRWARGS